MDKVKIGIIICIIFIIGSLIFLRDDNKSLGEEETSNAALVQNELPKVKAEKIQVFLFHATQRCSTCINIGKFAGETVNDYFQTELKDGKIEFREVNIDLPENKELTEKFKATGSILYINAIADGKDNIEEDTTVWRLTTNKEQFKNYFRDKLNSLFGK